ncbi:unnamed protein product [Closterium sp. Naga37s-1]|nr:unnamed protein product [Closterium sp. Naga37s-1]
MPPSNHRRPNAASVSPHEHHDPAASPPSASAVLMATDADVAAASPYGEDPQKAAAAAMAMTSPCPLLPGAKAAAAAMPSVFCFHSICYSVNLGRKKSLIRRCIEPCVGLAAKRKSTQFTSISDDEAKASAPPKIRVILNEISGFARSGEVLAIMGSSGCGKTTLLDVLSHRIASAAASAGPLAGGRTGYIELGDKPTTDDLMRRISAYVMQDDLMYATLTARETLMFSAEMNLPRSFSYKEKQERVERLLELLSLQHAANTLIGNENLRGVSGGERKRVAIGAHIVHDPKILFLDEPTSGLDSSNAYRVVKILKDIALTSESIVIMVIHQPSFRVLEQIDQLLMLSTGNMIFFGPPPHLPAFFDAFGTPVPKFANPTEFALELLEQLKSTSEAALMELVAFAADWHRSRDHMAHAKTGRHAKPALLAAPGGGGDGEETDSGGGSGAGAHGRKGADGKKKFCGLAGKLGKKGGKKGEEEEEEEVVESGHKGTHRYANSWFREFYILFVRSGLMIIRNPLLYFLRLMLLTVAGFLLASLFYKPTHDPQGMLERLAYLSFIVAMLFFCSADATPIFIMERNIFIRETSHNTYRASTYVVATMAVYIPLQALMAMTLTLESWWTVGLSGGFPGALFFATICFLCLFTGNAIATFASSFFKNMILAYATVISTMAYFTLVSGFYIHRTSIPKFWIWLHYISPMKYAFEALVQNEFVRDSGPCYLTLNGAFDIEPISTYVNTTRLKPVLMSFLPNVVTPGVGPLTSQSCIMTGTFISRKYLDIVELNKYQSMAVLFSMAISVRIGGKFLPKGQVPSKGASFFQRGKFLPKGQVPSKGASSFHSSLSTSLYNAPSLQSSVLKPPPHPFSPPPPPPSFPLSRHLPRVRSPSPPLISRITSLELDSPLDRRFIELNETPPPPVDAFPSLHTLTLLYQPSQYRFIARCSSLTSLTLWRPNAFALFSLASSSSPLHLSLSSLTIHSALLEAALTPLATFPHLTSLTFHSCTIDPCELHSLSRSLHTLTHLAVHDCPLVSSHSLATLVETNLALSSLSLHSTSYPLFAAQGLRNVLRSSSSRLHTLTLSGLPAFRPGTLARCSGLKCLTLRGRGEARESVSLSESTYESPQEPSLEGLVAFLVRVEEKGGGGGGVEQQGCLEGTEGGVDAVERREGKKRREGGTPASGSAAATAAATAAETAEEATAAGAAAESTAEAATPVPTHAGTRGNEDRRYYLDIRMEAAAACADTAAAIDDSRALLLTTAKQKLRKAISEAQETPRMHGESALANIRNAVILVRAAMSFCRCVRLAVVHVDGRMAREAALKNVGSAAESAGFFASAVDYEREEREREREGREGGGGGGREVEELVGFVPESDLPADLAEVSETLLGEQTGVWPAFVAVSREDARRLLHVLREQLDAHMESFIDAFEDATPLAVIWAAAAPGAPVAVPPPVPGPAAPVAAAPGAAAHGAAGAAAHGAVVDGAAALGAAADGVAADGAAADGAAADGAAADGAAADGAAADGVAAEGAAADGVAAEGAAAQELTSAEGEAGGPVGEGASTEGAAQQLPEAESGGGQRTGDEQTREDKQLGSRSPTHTSLKGRTTPNKSKCIPSKKSTPQNKSTPPNKSTLAIPVEVFCPPLESLTLESIQFAADYDPSWLPSSLPSASPLMCPLLPTTPLPSLHSSSSPYPVPRSLRSEPQTFKSLARATVFGRLKNLALLSCCGLGEAQLVRLLSACGMLEDLQLGGSDWFSDTVIAGSKQEVLTQLTAVGCGRVTADGIGGLLGNVPRLRRYLKVEASKVFERTRRELLRARVVVRGV